MTVVYKCIKPIILYTEFNVTNRKIHLRKSLEDSQFSPLFCKEASDYVKEESVLVDGLRYGYKTYFFVHASSTTSCVSAWVSMSHR